MALRIDRIGRSRTPQAQHALHGLRTIVRCGSPPTSPTQFALAGLGRVGAAIRLRQLWSMRFRCTGSPHHWGFPRCRGLAFSAFDARAPFLRSFGHRRCLTPRAFTAGGAFTEFTPTSDVLCRLTGTAGCRLQPIGSCRFRRPRFRENDGTNSPAWPGTPLTPPVKETLSTPQNAFRLVRLPQAFTCGPTPLALSVKITR